jgi:hypothetical protein
LVRGLENIGTRERGSKKGDCTRAAAEEAAPPTVLGDDKTAALLVRGVAV